jgi:hypothetical protein
VSRRYFIPVFALTLILGACSKTTFERAHEQAGARNPGGVELEIKTIDGSNRIHAGQTVNFEELYTSKYPGWALEVSDMNRACCAGHLFFSDGKTTWSEPKGPGAFVCCGYRHVWLSLDPTRLPYGRPASNAFAPAGYRAVLPRLPGKYQMYVTTRRVFNKEFQIDDYHEGFALTSNILTFEVVK